VTAHGADGRRGIGALRPGAWLRRVFRRAERRALPSGGYDPIEDYALIGDRVTCALVSKQGSIDWACFPRMDSPSVFARILDAKKGGCWRISPAVPYRTERRYLPDTNILETTFRTPDGEAVLIDFMPTQAADFERLGESAIIRIVRGVRGVVPFDLVFEPRFDYARSLPTWTVHERAGVRASHFDESLTLHTSVPLRVDGFAATASFRVAAGETATFVAAYRRPAPLVWRSGVEEEALRVLRATETYWKEWIARCTYDGPYADAVRRSALVLRLLDYAPTGAIVAAPTTSLPEDIGGVRNWDYRFCWIRDATYTLYAFNVLGYHAEAETFLSWVFDMTRGQPQSLRVLYGIGGEQENVEFELPHLEGYRGSRPVRVGNAAQRQRQLDIYGELLDVAFYEHLCGCSLAPDLWPLLRASVDYVCEAWRTPDYGLWEIRAAPRHFVYSKVLCWVAVDRGIRLARAYGLPCDLERWEAAAEEIRQTVLEQGFDPGRGTFTQAFGYADLDASLLALPLRGFLPATDPRMAATIERIATELAVGRERRLIRRTSPTFEDGLPGDEGAFLLVNFWLVDCLTMMGRLGEARERFEYLLSLANDVGLYAEMVDPDTGAHLGNFPQAFTHVALISSAANLAAAERQQPSPVLAPPQPRGS